MLGGQKLVLILLLLLMVQSLLGLGPPAWWKSLHQYNPDKSWYQYMSYTSAFFGPNALPVPELYDGRLPMNHQAELSSDVFWGYGDQTQSLSTRLVYAILPGRLTLHVWGVLAEHYQTTMAVRDLRASQVENAEETFIIGDLYLSTNLALLREQRIQPDLSLEVALKTSASKTSSSARYFDTPGYYFNLTAGKSLHFKHAFIEELRMVGAIGFLCYQLNSEFQNDALLFGGKLQLKRERWLLEGGIHGYSGWLDQGDRPLLLRGKLAFRSGPAQLFLQYQHALRDYPFRRIQTGICFDL